MTNSGTVPGLGWERLAQAVAHEVPSVEIDGVWLFTPLRRDSREWGTAVFSRVDGDRRRIYTARYALAIKGKEFVEAARSIGVRDARLLRVHILPNVGGDLLVFGSLWTASAIRLEASLSFIGLGVAPPTPTWGQMIREGTIHLTTVPMYSLGPGLALLLTVFAFNLVGDGLRDVLDPKARA